MHTDKCFFVVPTFNTYKDYQNGKVSRTVHEVLKDLIAVVKKNLMKKQEILIINDGSTDETERELLDLLKHTAIQLPERGMHNFFSYKLSILTSLSASMASILDPLESVTRYPDSKQRHFDESHPYVEHFRGLHDVVGLCLEKAEKAILN